MRKFSVQLIDVRGHDHLSDDREFSENSDFDSWVSNVCATDRPEIAEHQKRAYMFLNSPSWETSLSSIYCGICVAGKIVTST